jgi:hypothetical protein
MVFESWRGQLRWIIEHDGEYFHKWHIYKSTISWISKKESTFSLLFGCPEITITIAMRHITNATNWFRVAQTPYRNVKYFIEST